MCALGLADQRDGAGTGRGRRAGNERADLGGEESGEIFLRDAKFVRPDHLTLAHHHAAMELGGIFGGANLRQQRVQLAEPAILLHALGVACDLTERLGIGRDPGKPVGGVLLALERGAIDLAVRRELRGDRVHASVVEGGRRLSNSLEGGDEVGDAARLKVGRAFGKGCHRSISSKTAIGSGPRGKNRAEAPESNLKSEGRRRWRTRRRTSRRASPCSPRSRPRRCEGRCRAR